jgi:hypothetical protein
MRSQGKLLKRGTENGKKYTKECSENGNDVGKTSVGLGLGFGVDLPISIGVGGMISIRERPVGI